jgi:large subunit ribosomal protein L13
MKTYSAKPEDIKRDWFIIDAKGKTLGRLATKIATLLRGKHKPMYTPHMDTGDAVVVINAEHIGVTGSKEESKIYYSHTQYPGGLNEVALRDLRENHPTRILQKAVHGMLPKGPLGREMMRKFKVYAGTEHPHAAQQPKELEDI